MTKTIAMILLTLVAACASRQEDPSAERREPVTAAPEQGVGAPSKAAGLYTQIADPSTVCMVNDRFMGSAQIPVVVEGKTYYGCCKMCEKRLHDEPSVRSAIDPISHEQVDKASAVLAQDKSGNVLYFASESTLKRANGGS